MSEEYMEYQKPIEPYIPPLQVIFSEPEETYEYDGDGGQRPVTKIWSEVHGKKGMLIGLGVNALGHNLAPETRKAMMQRIRDTLADHWIKQSYDYAIAKQIGN